MDERLRAAGRSITLRRTVTRFVEYAAAVWLVAVLVLALSRWGDLDLTAMVVSLVMLGCAFAVIAAVHNLRFIESSRRERVLSRHDAGSHHTPA